MKTPITTTNQTDSLAEPSSPAFSPWRNGLLLVLFKIRWILLYVFTISALIWWYEFRPIQTASMKMQGDWQWSEGKLPNEQLLEKYLHVDKSESWFVYPLRDEWHVQRNRLTINRADDFFVVRRAFGFDHGTTRETEYVVCLKNDGLYILRGLTRLDSVLTPSVEKLRSVRSLPDNAKKEIEEYLSKLTK